MIIENKITFEWHTFGEIPEDGISEDILCLSKNGDMFLIRYDGGLYVYPDGYKKSFDTEKIFKWTYVNDLLPRTREATIEEYRTEVYFSWIDGRDVEYKKKEEDWDKAKIWDSPDFDWINYDYRMV